MTQDITIPPNVVEAAARAICEAENGPCECLPDECGCIFWKAHARAAILAALKAWTGKTEYAGFDADNTMRHTITLPTEVK